MGRAYIPQAKRTDWETPPELFDRLAEEFGPFDLDPCGGSDCYVSRQCTNYYVADGLDEAWYGRVFVNPPYGRVLRDWVYRGWFEATYGGASLVVALLPARTDTKWWHDYIGAHCEKASEVRFIKGRLRFVGAEASAPFPSTVVVWRGRAGGQELRRR